MKKQKILYAFVIVTVATIVGGALNFTPVARHKSGAIDDVNAQSLLKGSIDSSDATSKGQTNRDLNSQPNNENEIAIQAVLNNSDEINKPKNTNLTNNSIVLNSVAKQSVGAPSNNGTNSSIEIAKQNNSNLKANSQSIEKNEIVLVETNNKPQHSSIENIEKQSKGNQITIAIPMIKSN